MTKIKMDGDETRLNEVIKRVKEAATVEEGIRIMRQEYGGGPHTWRQEVLWARLGDVMDDVVLGDKVQR